MRVFVATIGVLVAISIPIFTAQLEKSREAVDAANIRAAYAELSVDAITGDVSTDMDKYKVTLKQETEGWQTSFDFPENLKEGSTAPKKGTDCTFTYDASTGDITANIKLKKA